MDKIKKFIDCYIDTETCNLQCHYCYIALTNRFKKNIAKFGHTPEEIRIALSKKRLGGPCLINFCAGGETLLSDEVVPVLKALLEEGHYLMVVTNGTIDKRFDEIINLSSDLLQKLFFKFSFHYLELKRLNLLDNFFNNIDKVQKAGCSFTVEITPNDEIISSIDEIMNICQKKLGTLCHITIARDDRTENINILSKYNLDEYIKIWNVFDSDLFDFKTAIFQKKRKEFCYAGDWSFYLNLTTGNIKQCYCGKNLGNIYINIDKPLKLEAIGTNCSLPYCYNGHAFLALGTIPELTAPTYDKLRNRISNTGKEWLQPTMKNFMAQKLYDNNEPYSNKRKKNINRKYKITNFRNNIFNMGKRILKKFSS